MINKIKINIDRIKKDPYKYFLNLFVLMTERIRNNTLFFIFVMTALFNGFLLRYFTIGPWETLFAIKPLLADLAVILFAGSFAFLFKAKNRIYYLFIMNSVFTGICIINSIYYTFYKSFSSISLITLTKQFADVSDAATKTVIMLKDWIYLFSPIVLLIAYFVLKKNKKYYKKDKKHMHKFKKTLQISLITAFIFVLTLTSVDMSRFAKMWNREYIVMKFGIYTYHVNDLFKSLEPKLSTLFGYDNAIRVFNEFYDKVPENETNDYTNIFEGKNIITIHAESMQQFLIGLEFNGEEVTPNLNKIYKESIAFSNFYSQVSVGTSSDTELTFLTSLMPSNTGTVFGSFFDREFVSTPLLLKKKGYDTYSMHANKKAFWNRDVMHKNLGYDRFFSKDDYVIDEIIGLGLSDVSFFNQSLEKIKEIDNKNIPYYLNLITLTNHTPFAEVEKYGPFDVDMKIKNENDNTITSYPYMEGTKLGDYFKSAHYADKALGDFVNSMEKEGLLDNTILIVYGDHDARLPLDDFQRLVNYDYKTNSLLNETDSKYKVFDEYQYELYKKVPLMIYSKETKETYKKVISTTMGMIDVMPTLGNMFNFYNEYQLGTDIFNTLEDNVVVFPNSSWVSNKIYFNAPKNEYYSLKEGVITNEYIDKGSDKANKLLEVSNAIINFDLIKHDRLIKEKEYVDERNIKNEKTK